MRSGTLKLGAFGVLFALVIFFCAFTVNARGCYQTIKDKSGDLSKKAGDDIIENTVPGSSQKDEQTGQYQTSIVEDLMQLAAAIWRGTKDFGDLIKYLLGLILLYLGHALRVSKFKKEVGLNKIGLKTVIKVIEDFKNGKGTIKGNGANPSDVAAAIAERVKTNSGTRNTAVGGVIHAAVKAVKNGSK